MIEQAFGLTIALPKVGEFPCGTARTIHQGRIGRNARSHPVAALFSGEGGLRPRPRAPSFLRPGPARHCRKLRDLHGGEGVVALTAAMLGRAAQPSGPPAPSPAPAVAQPPSARVTSTNPEAPHATTADHHATPARSAPASTRPASTVEQPDATPSCSARRGPTPAQPGATPTRPSPAAAQPGATPTRPSPAAAQPGATPTRPGPAAAQPDRTPRAPSPSVAPPDPTLAHPSRAAAQLKPTPELPGPPPPARARGPDARLRGCRHVNGPASRCWARDSFRILPDASVIPVDAPTLFPRRASAQLHYLRCGDRTMGGIHRDYSTRATVFS